MNELGPGIHPELSSLQHPWDDNGNVIWIASKLRLNRNIGKFKFPQKLETERKKHILSLATKAMLSAKGLSQGIVLKGETLTSTEKEFLIEHFFIFEGFQEAREGTAFFVDRSGTFIALFNMKEHLQLHLLDCEGDLEKSWEQLVRIENQLSETLGFAFSSKFGFLTSDPFCCGTGLTTCAYLHVPALIHTNQLTAHIEREKTEGLLCSGIQGNPDELLGDIIMIRNFHTLGTSEEAILSLVRNSVLRLVIAEKDARGKIKSEGTSSVKDAISRAYGLLKYSYRFETQEALGAVSLLKLGIELGWVKNLGVKEANRLLFQLRRAHLTYLLEQSREGSPQGPQKGLIKERLIKDGPIEEGSTKDGLVAAQELAQRRATYLHNCMARAELDLFSTPV